MMKKVNEYPINSIKHLMLVSFFCILDEELKCIAKKTDDYYIYDMWREKGYKFLNAKQIDGLKKLDLSFLGLKNVPKEIGYFQNLEELNLSGNYIHNLPVEIYNLKNLKVLNLGDVISGGNKIKCISKNIEKLTNLEVLKLVWNDELKELPKEILNLKKLELIFLSQQAILETDVGKEIEKTFFVDFEDFQN